MLASIIPERRSRRSSTQRARRRRSHRQNNFSEVPVLAHVRLRRYRFIEWEAPVDRQLELAHRHRIPQIGAHTATDLAHLLERAGTKGHADIFDAPQRVQVEIEL